MMTVIMFFLLNKAAKTLLENKNKTGYFKRTGNNQIFTLAKKKTFYPKHSWSLKLKASYVFGVLAPFFSHPPSGCTHPPGPQYKYTFNNMTIRWGRKQKWRLKYVISILTIRVSPEKVRYWRHTRHCYLSNVRLHHHGWWTWKMTLPTAKENTRKQSESPESIVSSLPH